MSRVYVVCMITYIIWLKVCRHLTSPSTSPDCYHKMQARICLAFLYILHNYSFPSLYWWKNLCPAQSPKLNTTEHLYSDQKGRLHLNRREKEHWLHINAYCFEDVQQTYIGVMVCMYNVYVARRQCVEDNGTILKSSMYNRTKFPIIMCSK